MNTRVSNPFPKQLKEVCAHVLDEQARKGVKKNFSKNGKNM